MVSEEEEEIHTTESAWLAALLVELSDRIWGREAVHDRRMAVRIKNGESLDAIVAVLRCNGLLVGENASFGRQLSIVKSLMFLWCIPITLPVIG